MRLLTPILAAFLFTTPLLAQGMDSTPAERNLRIMAEMLDGIYDNANQAYFDGRRGLPEAERHERMNMAFFRMEPKDGPGQPVWMWDQEVTIGEESHSGSYIVALRANETDHEVVMHIWSTSNGNKDLLKNGECRIYFSRRADHFTGILRGDPCETSVQTIQLSKNGLVVGYGEADKEPYWLERARIFHCYSDVPGVGGGRDENFERYGEFELHDMGGMKWFTTKKGGAEKDGGRNLGFNLRRVTWHVLNEGPDGPFNRNSLVLSVLEKLADGSVKEHGYAFAAPDADRLGLNLKFMLVNCAMTRRTDAKPEM